MEIQSAVRRRASKPSLDAQVPPHVGDLIRAMVRDMVLAAMAEDAPRRESSAGGPLPARGPPPLDPMLSITEVMVATGMSKSAIYGQIKAGKFPAPVKLSTRCVRWRRSAVEAFLAAA